MPKSTREPHAFCIWSCRKEGSRARCSCLGDGKIASGKPSRITRRWKGYRRTLRLGVEAAQAKKGVKPVLRRLLGYRESIFCLSSQIVEVVSDQRALPRISPRVA
jgi:hypothetical protein